MIEEPNVVLAYVKLAEMGMALGVESINKLPGCWECAIDEHWSIAWNGHSTPTKCSLSTLPIEPFMVYVQFNGWPAGILGPSGGVIAAGEAANEDTFLAAIEARIAVEKARV